MDYHQIIAHAQIAFSSAPVSRRQILLILYGFPVFLASLKKAPYDEPSYGGLFIDPVRSGGRTPTR